MGILSGIPLWESFPQLGEVVPTIDKGQVILNAAFSGVGKSMITRYKDIIAPWLYVRNHPELEIDLRFVVFLLEDDRNRFVDYMISTLLYLKFSIAVSPKQLRSAYRDSVSEDILNKIAEIQDDIDDLLSRCTIEDSTYNSYGIYKTCRLKSEEWGTHYYTQLMAEETYITKTQYNELPKLPENLKDLSVEELRNRYKVNPLEYQDFWKYSHYEASNPKQQVIMVVDNINCLVPDKYEVTLKAAMDNFMYNYCRTNIAKHWSWTVVAVQQFVGGQEEKKYSNTGQQIKDNQEPSLDKLGDSKLTQRACHLIYGLHDPFRYGHKTYHHYEIRDMRGLARFLFIIKNNDGEANLMYPLYFRGESSVFKELPHYEAMGPIYERIKKGVNL